MNQEIVTGVHYLEIWAMVRRPDQERMWRLWGVGLGQQGGKETVLCMGSHVAFFIVLDFFLWSCCFYS